MTAEQKLPDASAGCVSVPLFTGKGSVEAFVACIDLIRDQEPNVVQKLLRDWLIVVLKRNREQQYTSRPLERVVFVPKGDDRRSVEFSLDDVGKHNHGLVIPARCRGKAVCHAYTGAGVWWIKSPKDYRGQQIDFVAQLLQDPSAATPDFLFKRILLLPVWMRHQRYKPVYKHLFVSFPQIDAFFLVESKRAILYGFQAE